MNPIEAVVRRVDTAQQRHNATGFVFGIIKKFGDDNAGALVTNLAYAGFVSLFPLLLILTTILGLIASADPAIREQALDAVSKQVPLIGQQLTGSVHELRQSSIIGLIVGVAVLLWGTTRLAQAGIFTMEQVWNLPGPARVGYFPRLLRCVQFLGVLGLGVVVTTVLTGLEAFTHQPVLTVVMATVLAMITNAGMFLIGFRVLTPGSISLRRLLPGAIAGGIAWTALQTVGTLLVRQALHGAAAYGVFATVLGLLAWVYLGAEVAVYAAELNVVVARRLWPRALVQPPLTEADRHSMALQALQNQRREEQQIRVTFTDRPPGVRRAATTPRTPEDILHPDADPSPPPSSGADRREG
ncbi:MAG: YihY/virulence factor BrkB family protein [Streptosporangiaceae bacterium]